MGGIKFLPERKNSAEIAKTCVFQHKTLGACLMSAHPLELKKKRKNFGITSEASEKFNSRTFFLPQVTFSEHTKKPNRCLRSDPPYFLQLWSKVTQFFCELTPHIFIKYVLYFLIKLKFR